jgi:hypothetical protein
MEKLMHLPVHPRDRRSGPLGTLSCVLLFAAATVIGCGLATAADDKAKAVVETPSKAAAGQAVTTNPAAAGVTTGPTMNVTGSSTADAKTDSDAAPSKKAQRRRGHIQIGDDDFDSEDALHFNTFNDALRTAPWVIGLAFLVAGSVFLTPVFLLIGIIWYKLRKTRLQNDAVLKLAERGVMPPAQAVDAVMSGVTPEAAAASAEGPLAASTAAPVYQQAVIARRRAVWSDLRKGVILTAIGLSFVFYSMVESGSANWLGLVLLFLGLGYILLWWFEDRHLQRREAGAGVDVGKS